MEVLIIAKKIAVVAANGRVAGKGIAEAVSRGFDVTGFGRKENNTKAQHYVKKDLFDLTTEDLKGFDAVVDGFGAKMVFGFYTNTNSHFFTIFR